LEKCGENTLIFAVLSGCLLLTAKLYTQVLTAQESANKAYIFGFLAGLQHTEKAPRSNNEKSNRQAQSDFFQRSFKARLGREPQRLSSSTEDTYCLPDKGISDHELKSMMDKFDESSMNKQTDKAQQLFKVVQSTYPCS
jgi:hypothetical protein